MEPLLCTPKALQFCQCLCRARLVPQVFSPMNAPHPALVKNPSAYPGSRPPGSPEDNTPILWEVEETKLDQRVL